MKVKTFILTFLMMMSCPFLFGQHWTPGNLYYPGTMQVTSKIYLDDNQQTDTEYEVAAFCGTELLAAEKIKAVGTEPNQLFHVDLNVKGSNGLGKIYFKLFDGTNEYVSVEEIEFVNQGTYGTHTAPETINFKSVAQIEGTDYDVVYPSIDDAIAAAQAGETVTILAGNHTQNLNINKAITVQGERDGDANLVNIAGKLNITADGATAKNLNVNNGGNSAGYIGAKDVTVDGCTVVGGNGFRYCYTTGLVTFSNSTITGSTYGIHFDGSAGGNIVIENCDITGWTSFAGTITNVAISGTDFLNGNYNQLRFYQNAQMTNCKFNPDMTIDFGKDDVDADFITCQVTDGSPLTDVIYLGDIADMGVDVTIDNEPVIIEASVTHGENTSYYFTFTEAMGAIKNLSGDVTIKLYADATFDYNARDAYGTASTTSLTINGNSNTLTLNQKNSDWSSFGLANANAKVVFNNMTIEKTGYGDTSGAWNTHAIIFSSNVEMNEVTVNNSMAVQNGATLKNVTINEANAYYGLWINGNGQSVTMNGGAITATNGGRGIKIADQYIDSPASVTLNVTGTKFNTAKKAAVLVSSEAGAAITASNVDITNVAEDNVNFVWVDEDWAADYGKVTVTGASLSQENLPAFTAAIMNGDNVKGYYKTLPEAITAAQTNNVVTILAGNYSMDVDINKPITVQGATDEEGNNLVNIAGKLNITADDATAKNINVNNGSSTAGVINAKDVTVDGCTVVGGNGFRYCYTTGLVTFKNSTITGGTYGIHFDGSAGGNIVIDNCVITGWTSFARTITKVTMKGTSFEEGNYNYVRFYQSEVDIDNCTFNEKMAIDIAVEGNETTVDGCTFVNGNVEDLFYGEDIVKSTIIVDGVTLSREASIGNTYYQTLADAIAAAQNGDEVKILVVGNYAVPTGKNITITGAVDGVSFGTIGAVGMGGASVTFNNVTFNYANNSTYKGLQHSGNLVYNNCTFNGQVFLYGESETFNKCTFNQTTENYNVWTYGAKEVAFNECTFNSAGKSVLIYSEDKNLFNNVAVTKCTFKASAPVEGKAAIEMDSSLTAGIKLTIDGETTATGFDNGNVSGNSLWNNKKGNETEANNDITVVVNNETVLEPLTLVAQIGETKYTSLQTALNTAAAGTGNVTVTILSDVNLTDVDWNPVTVSAPGYPVVTVEGNSKTITGLNDMLFAGTWAGGSGLIIKNLTIENSAIVNDKDDVKGTVGVGAFIGYPQASATITLEKCHLKNSSVEGGHWTGGLIGMAGGYNGNDGPVFMNLTIKDCSVTGSAITGKGSVGGIIGHGSCAAWTSVDIDGTTVSGNTITSTGSSNIKAGAVMGTIGAAGQPTTADGETKTGGATVSATVSDNTVTSNNTVITTIYGRQGTETGMLYLDGGSYDKYPIEKGVAYAAPIEGYEIEKTNGVYTVVKSTVAKIGATEYKYLQEAITAAGTAETTIDVILSTTEDITIAEVASITLNFAENVVLNGYIAPFKGNLTIKGGTINNTNSSKSAIEINAGNLNLENVKVTSARHGIRIDGTVVATISGGEYHGGKTTGTRHALNVSGAANVRIIDGTFVGPKGTSSDSGAAINVKAGSTVTIEGGDFSGGKNNTLSVAGTMQITGGTFDQDPSAYKKEGYFVRYDESISRYVVYLGVAKIGDVYYGTLASAIDAATAGNTIVFCADITEDVTVSKSVTIDGANFNYTGNISVSGSTTAMTVKNVNFVDGAGYAVTTNRINSITVEDCTVTSYASGFLYANKSTPTVNVKNVTVNGGYYGLHWVYGTTATLENVTMTNVTYGLYIQNYAGKTINVKGCNISSIVIDEKATGVQKFNFEGKNTVVTLSTSQYAEYVLAAADAKLTAPEGSTVTTSVEGSIVKYDGTKYYVTGVVAQIGDKLYASLQEAINAVPEQGNAEITVLKDIALSDTGLEKVDGYDTYFLVEGKSVTVNMNGKKISGEYTGNLLVGVFSTDNDGHLTLTGNGTIDVTATGTVYTLVNCYNDGSTITIEDGTYKLDKASDNLVFYGGYTDEAVTVNGGTFELGNVGIGENGKPWIFNVLGAGDHHVLVNGGTFNADVNRQHWSNEAYVAKECYTEVNTDANGKTTYTVKKGAEACVYTGMLIGPYFYRKDIGYKTLAEAIAKAIEFDDPAVTVLKTVNLGETIIVNGEVNLNFAEEGTVTSTVNPAFRITNGAEVTVQNGNMNTENGGYNFILGASDGSVGNLTIESGKYHGLTSVASVTNGNLTINGGEFSVKPWYENENSEPNYNFLINCIDANYTAGTAKVAIKGGTFHKFNPRNNAAEGIDTNFCPFGYTAIYDADTETYTVIPAQEQYLGQGFNWYSSYLKIDTDDLLSALGTSGKTVVSGDWSATYYTRGWDYDSHTFDYSKMYMIETSAEHTLYLSGELLDAAEIEITLEKNWNWIGYPSNETVSTSVALENLNPTLGDRLVGQAGFVEYVPALGGWVGSLEYFEPTNGYQYYSNNDNDVTFTYNIVPATTRGNNKVANHYSVDYTEYPFNMTMVAVVDDVMDGNYEVAAFVNGEVRGSARPIYIEALNSSMLFLTISGGDVEEVSFKLYDIDTDTEYDLVNRINYSNNAIVGSVNEPYVLSRGTMGIGEASLSEINIYPNPTTTGREINLQATCDKVEVFNALGVKVAEYQNVDSIDAFETAGIYVIRLTNNGDVKHCRLIVR